MFLSNISDSEFADNIIETEMGQNNAGQAWVMYVIIKYNSFYDLCNIIVVISKYIVF